MHLDQVVPSQVMLSIRWIVNFNGKILFSIVKTRGPLGCKKYFKPKEKNGVEMGVLNEFASDRFKVP